MASTKITKGKVPMETGLQTGLNKLWTEEKIMDVILTVEGQELKAHKVVIAAASEFFREKLLDKANVDTRQIILENIDARLVSKFLKSIYNGRFDSSEINLTEVSRCAEFFKLPEDVVKACKDQEMKGDSVFVIPLKIQKGIDDLYKEKQLVDYTIVVDTQEFRVHKAVMVAVSDYFTSMLCGSMIESEKDRVQLERICAESVSAIIDLVYSGDVNVFKQNLMEVFECAVYFQMLAVVESCCKILLNNPKPGTCMRALSLFLLYSYPNEVETVKDYMKSNMLAVIRRCKPEERTLEGLEFILEFPWDRTEWERFRYIVDWVNADYEKNQVHLEKLLAEIRFSLIPQDKVAEVTDMNVFKKANNESLSWCKLVAETEKYHQLPPHQKVLETSTQSKVRVDPELVFIHKEPGKDGEPKLFLYSQMNGKKWVRQKIPDGPDFGIYGDAVLVVVNNFLMVCSRRHTKQTWHVFDPRDMTWTRMPSMLTPKSKFTLVHKGGKLYAIGGKVWESESRVGPTSRHVEVYDFNTNTWSIGPKMTSSVSRHASCCIGSAIYLSGGVQEKNTSITNGNAMDWKNDNFSGSTKMDCLDILTGCWRKCAPMPKELKDHSMFTMKKCNTEMAVVIDTNFDITYYHPTRNDWTHIRPRFTSELSYVYNCSPDVALVRGVKNIVYLLNMVGAEMKDEEKQKKVLEGRRCFCRRCHDEESEDEHSNHGTMGCINLPADYDSDEEETGIRFVRHYSSDEEEPELLLCRKWDFENYGGYPIESSLKLPFSVEEDEVAHDFCAVMLAVPNHNKPKVKTPEADPVIEGLISEVAESLEISPEQVVFERPGGFTGNVEDYQISIRERKPSLEEEEEVCFILTLHKIQSDACGQPNPAGGSDPEVDSVIPQIAKHLKVAPDQIRYELPSAWTGKLEDYKMKPVRLEVVQGEAMYELKLERRYSPGMAGLLEQAREISGK